MKAPEIKKGTVVLEVPERGDITDTDLLFYYLGVVTDVWQHPGEPQRCGIVSFSSARNCNKDALIALLELPKEKNHVNFSDTLAENKDAVLIAALSALCRMQKERTALERVERRLLIEDALER